MNMSIKNSNIILINGVTYAIEHMVIIKSAPCNYRQLNNVSQRSF